MASSCLVMNQIHHDVCATSEGNRLSKSAGVVTPLGVQQGEAWVMLVKLEFDQHKNLVFTRRERWIDQHDQTKD